MNTNSKFSVALPPFGFRIGLILNIIIMLFVLLYSIVSENTPHIAMFVLFSLLMLMPTYLMLMTKLFRIIVNGNTISVRTSFGIKYRFDVKEIACITWRTRERGYMHTEKILIFISTGKKVSAETIMVGFDDMAAFLSANVDNSKINTISHKHKSIPS